MARLGDVVEQIRGVSYKPEDLHDTLNENSVMLLRANNIQNGTLNFDDVVFVDKSKVKQSQYLRAGDIFVCASSGSKDLVGKAVYVFEDIPAVFGAFCKVVRPKGENSRYIGHYFDSPSYRKKISDSAAGANINNIRNEHIDELFIRFPALNVQEEISVLFDKLNHMIFLRKQQLTKLDKLVKSRFVELFGDPEFNCKGWPVRTLDELCSVGSSKRIYQNEQSSEGVPFLRISDLVSKMDTGVAESNLFIPEEKYLELQRSNLVPMPGDILVTSRGTLGRCYIIQATDRFYFQDGMISWLSNYDDGVTPLYLQYLFTMSGFRKQIDSMQAGSTVAYLSIAMLKKLRVMVPCKDEQERFAAFVEQTDKSKLAIQQSLDKLETLKKALMQEYFG